MCLEMQEALVDGEIRPARFIGQLVFCACYEYTGVLEREKALMGSEN